MTINYGLFWKLSRGSGQRDSHISTAPWWRSFYDCTRMRAQETVIWREPSNRQ
jgi:hypothetical protein